jgi:protein involved in polysaccharide export with SLBB domain
MIATLSRACLAALICLPLLPGARRAAALELPSDLRKRLLGDLDAGKSPSSSALLGQENSADVSMDPQRYLVGSGDRFQIAIKGLPSSGVLVTVDEDGNIYDGELGFIPLGKIPLAKARAQIGDKVKLALRRQNDVYVALKSVKPVSVTVTGTLPNPGTFTLPGSQRVLDALKQANNGQMPAPDKFNLRRVVIRNGDSTRECDLLRFLNRQDPDQNPYVYPGDIIALHQVDARIYVTGEVRDHAVGWIPLLPGETVGDILGLLNLKETADTGAILLQGPEGGGGFRTASGVRSAPLHNNDVLGVGPKASAGRADTVRITGEVMRPGTYPAMMGTTAAALIAMAGGPTGYASPNRLFILRRQKQEEMRSNGGAERAPNGMIPGPAKMDLGTLQSVRPEVASSVNDLRNSADYILVDVSGKGGDATVEDGDEIHIPRKETSVYVSGNVRRPGAYPYEAGKTWKDYLASAHGTTPKADTKNAYVLATCQGVTQIKDLDRVMPGDILVIPAAIEYKRFTNVWLPIIQIVPTLISLAISLYVLNQQSGK